MKTRALLTAGMAMPLIYLAALIAGALLFPGYHPLTQEPSVLGGPEAAQPLPFNAGLIRTGAAGVSGAVGVAMAFLALRKSALLGGLAGLTLLLASVGLAMAGIFPLPDPRHYGFGLSALAVFTPLLGAFATLRVGGAGKTAAALAGFFLLILALVLVKAQPPFAAGLAMMLSVSFLCFSLRGRLQSL